MANHQSNSTKSPIIFEAFNIFTKYISHKKIFIRTATNIYVYSRCDAISARGVIVTYSNTTPTGDKTVCNGFKWHCTDSGKLCISNPFSTANNCYE